MSEDREYLEYRHYRQKYNHDTHGPLEEWKDTGLMSCEKCGAAERQLFDRTCVQQQILNLVKNPPVNVTAQGQQLPNK